MTERWPYVAIEEELTALRGVDGCRFLLSRSFAARMLPSAPVSTKKRVPDSLSVTKNRRPSEENESLAAVSDSSFRFPRSRCKDARNDGPCVRTSGGTNREEGSLVKGCGEGGTGNAVGAMMEDEGLVCGVLAGVGP